MVVNTRHPDYQGQNKKVSVDFCDEWLLKLHQEILSLKNGMASRDKKIEELEKEIKELREKPIAVESLHQMV